MLTSYITTVHLSRLRILSCRLWISSAFHYWSSFLGSSPGFVAFGVHTLFKIVTPDSYHIWQNTSFYRDNSVSLFIHTEVQKSSRWSVFLFLGDTVEPLTHSHSHFQLTMLFPIFRFDTVQLRMAKCDWITYLTNSPHSICSGGKEVIYS